MKSIYLFIILFLSFFSITAHSKTLVDKVIAIVNSDPIFQSDLDLLVLNASKPGFIDETLAIDFSISDIKNKKEFQIKYLIYETLLKIEIKKLGLSLSDDKIMFEINQMASKNKMSLDQFKSMIEKEGFAFEDYKSNLKSRMEKKSFFETEIVNKLRISDEDAYSDYQSRFPNYKSNASEYSLAQIYFDKSIQSQTSAEERAEAVYKKLLQGEKFELLANKNSEEKRAAEGGFFGNFKTGDLSSDLEKIINGLEKGQFSKPISTKTSVIILKVIDKKVTKDPQFEKYKPQIKAKLVEQAFQRQLKNWLDSKFSDSYLKIYE